MTFGFIGAGSVAQTIAKHLLQHGQEVVLSNRWGADTLSELVASLGNGASAATPTEAARQDYVVVSVMCLTLRKLCRRYLIGPAASSSTRPSVL